MLQDILEICYLIASISFILGLKMQSSPDTARKGNFIGAFGMGLATVATIVVVGFIENSSLINFIIVFAGISAGASYGMYESKNVKMTGMPEMVAIFNGYGGLASLLISVTEYHNSLQDGGVPTMGFLISLCLGSLIGGVTFTGSLVAWGKLSGKMKDFTLPFQQVINVLVMVAILVLCVLVVIQGGGTWPIIISLAALSLIYGLFFAMPIGGADMPVAIALLNSFSGIAGIFAGFLINNECWDFGRFFRCDLINHDV